MSRSITDARQVTLRSFLAQIANATTYAGTADAKPANQSELDNLLLAINDELTQLLRMSASSTPDLIVTVGAGVLINSENSRTRSIPHIGLSLPTFTSGTITFPASSGGTIAVSPGTNGTLTVSSGNYIKVLIYLDSSGNLKVSSGTENAVEGSATVPKAPIDTLPLGYVTLQNVGGTIQNIAQGNIYQFDIGSGVTNSGLDSQFFISDVTDATIKIFFDAAGSTGTSTTIVSSQTVDRTQTLQDATDTFVYRNTTDALANKQIQFSSVNDGTTTGADATAQAFTTGVIRLTNASLSSLAGIPAGSSGQFLLIENMTGQAITVKNDNSGASASNRIYTGISADLPFADKASISLVYDSSVSRWVITGGSGSGSNTVVTDTFSGTGAQVDFTLTNDPGSIDNLLVYVHGVYQQKSTYSLSGTTLTFTAAPPSAANNIEVKYGVNLAGAALPLSTPPLLVVFNSGSGNYVPSANTKYIKFQLWGSGGGGCGSSRGSSNDATNGSSGSGSSTFGSSSAGAGVGGTKASGRPPDGGAGGSATLGGDAFSGFALTGEDGGNGNQSNAGSGANGGSSPYQGGAGKGGGGLHAAFAPRANSGSGGGGGGGTAEVSASFTGAGGGSGGYVEGYINNPGTIAYSIATGGAGGAGGTGPGFAGSAGADGKLIIWEYK